MNKTKRTTKEIIRIPRPMGYTNACIHNNTYPSKSNLRRLRDISLQHFINNQFLTIKPIFHPTKNIKENLNNHKEKYSILTMTIDDISRTIQMRVDKCEARIVALLSKQAKKMADSGMFEDLVGNSRAMIFRLFFGSLNRIEAFSGWEEELKQASRANYHKPGYSMAATSAMGATNQLMAQALKMAEGLQPKASPLPNPTNINIQNNQAVAIGPDGKANGLMTPDMAVQMLAEHSITHIPLHDKANHFAHLAEAHLTDSDIPNVTATASDAQGVAKSKSLDFMALAKQTSHETRREDEVGVIVDATE